MDQFLHPQEDSQEEEGRTMLSDPSFLLPCDVSLPSMSDSLEDGFEVICVNGQVVSPSEFYLLPVSAFDFPDGIVMFMLGMSDQYHSWFRQPHRQMWMLGEKPQFVQVGGIVACSHPNQQPSSPGCRQRDVVRAKIVRDSSVGGVKKYDVFLMDMGEYATDVDLGDMFFLHEMFVKEPTPAIRCRLHLDPFYDGYHAGLQQWDQHVTNSLVELMNKKMLHVQFVRQVVENDEKIWEVSILGTDPRHPDFEWGEPIERQLIRKCMGAYVNSSEQ